MARTPNYPSLMITDNYFMEMMQKIGNARIIHWYYTLKVSKEISLMSGREAELWPDISIQNFIKA